MSAIDSSLRGLTDLDVIESHLLEQKWQEKLTAANIKPDYLVLPHSTASLSQLIQLAFQEKWPFIPCGQGSQLSWGGQASSPLLVISTEKLNSIIDHAVGDLTVTVEAGVKLADLQAILGGSGQFLPIEPTYPQEATLGGIMATGDTGSLRQRYGGLRDLVLGFSFVRSDGKIAKAGGRVVKNVAGYDLMKLFIGSYGTLGVISEITFRTYPLSGVSETVLLTGASSAIEAASRSLLCSSLTPTRADLLSRSTVETLNLGTGMGLMVSFNSIPESVEKQGNILEELGKKLGLDSTRYREAEERELWEKLLALTGVPDSPNAVTCKVGLLPNKAVSFLDRLEQLTEKKAFANIYLSSGLGRLHILEENLSQLQELRKLCESYQGFLTLLESSVTLKDNFEPWGYPGGYKSHTMALMKKIKAQFDPDSLLSRDRFLFV